MNKYLTIDEFLLLAITEDVGDGDVSSLATIPKDRNSRAQLIIKEDGIFAGVFIARKIFEMVDKSLLMNINIIDGTAVKVGDIVFQVEGNVQAILKAERLVLNMMQRMSGIATKTNHLVKMLEGYKTKLLDTRKTTPNFRMFEKMAVKIGGGKNHRFGLYDMIMIKDNHIDFAGGIPQSITAANAYLKASGKSLKIEIEARNINEVEEILNIGGIDRIMLDNFSIHNLKVAVEMIAGKYETEASGNINANTILDYAGCGVDYVSMGALTHSYSSLDMSLKAY